MLKTLVVLLLSNVDQTPFIDPASAKPDTLQTTAPVAFAPEGRLPVTLTIHGGVSLGSYEAGYNWALLRMLRNSGSDTGRFMVKLSALSGASAGNINVFLGAIDWLEATPTPLEDNLLWKAWINVGLPQLLPSSQEDCDAYAATLQAYAPTTDPSIAGCPKYQPDDGLLSRRAFERIYAQIRERLSAGNFRAQEAVNLGVSLTLVEPTTIPMGELKVQTQRAFTTMTTSVRNGHLDFLELALDDPSKSLGQPVYFPAQPSGSLNAHISDIATASSAFPVALGPKPLCVFFDGVTQRDALEPCTTRRFLDGGVFDNAPVRLARTLRGAELGLSLDLDPDLKNAPAEATKVPPRPGLDETLTILLGAVTTARKAELLNLQDGGRPEDHVLRLARTVRVYGEHLGAFAAFIAHAYRRYDYYAGVFDAASFFADDRCYQTSPRFWTDVPTDRNKPVERDACYFTTMTTLYNELEVEGSHDAAYVFHAFLTAEASNRHVEGQLAAPDATQTNPAIVAVAKAIAAGPSPKAQATNIASNALLRDGTLGLLTRLAEDKDFTEARNACKKDELTEPQKLACVDVLELDVIIDDVNGWAASRTRDLLARMHNVEQESQYAAGEVVADLAQFAFEQNILPRRAGFQQTWTVPRWSRAWPWMGVIPNIIDVHLKDGGGSFRYLPAYGTKTPIAFILPITPLWWQRDLDRRNSWRTYGAIGLGLQYRTGSIGFSAAELAVHVLETYNRGDREKFYERGSIELGGYFAAGKVHTALQCGFRNGPAYDDPGLILPRECLFKLGIADLAGIIYWGWRLGK